MPLAIGGNPSTRLITIHYTTRMPQFAMSASVLSNNHTAHLSLAIRKSQYRTIRAITLSAWKMSEALDVDALDEPSRLARVSLDFETDHMLNWLPKMAQRASGHSTCFFYPQLCTFAAALVNFDMQLLKEIARHQLVNHHACNL